jgi:MerR family transcriptional regulator/heat shock protein HspR
VPDAPAHHDSEDPLISIGVLAQQVGLSVSAVRKYENEGLLIAHRTASGRRLFSQEDISRVRTIQHLVHDLGLNIEGIHRLQALLPCWELRPCSEETRNACPAYKESTRPCWMLKALESVPQGNECRGCAVYRFGSLCTEEIKQLLHDQNDVQDAGAAIRELMQRKRYSTEEER